MRIDRIKLITELKRRYMTQKALAERAGISRGTVGNICSGKSCSDYVGQSIARALDVDITDIIEEIRA